MPLLNEGSSISLHFAQSIFFDCAILDLWCVIHVHVICQLIKNHIHSAHFTKDACHEYIVSNLLKKIINMVLSAAKYVGDAFLLSSPGTNIYMG
jgi:hypothetical protein